MLIDPALPTAAEATAGAQQQQAEPPANEAQQQHAEGEAGQQAEGEGEKSKPEKTEAERERDRLRRGIDRKTRQAAEARAERDHYKSQLERLQSGGGQRDNSGNDNDEPLTLSRAELAQMVKSEAERLAPTLKQQQSEIEHRKTVVESLQKNLGQERFDALAEDLDEALGGLQRDGRAAPATEAIFAADDPQAVIEYLANPDNADEAESLGRMDAVRAGRAIAKLEGKLEQAKAAGKPQRSKAPEPIEPSKGAANGTATTPDPSSPNYIEWKLRQMGKR